jgi:hypothetical protein
MEQGQVIALDSNKMELFLVLGTWALVFVTFWFAHKQVSLLHQQTDDAHANIRLQNHLIFTARFDSPEMLRGRKGLAEHFLSSRPPEVQERVLEFFEDLGLFLRRGYLDEELLWNTFGFYAVRWWTICKGYTLEERKRQSDPTLFADFEDLAKRFLARDSEAGLTEATPSDIESFLKDERDLEK